LIATERDPGDGRKVIYSLTAKGIDLAPVMSEMVLWAAAHEDTGNEALVKEIQKDKEGFIAAVREHWAASSAAKRDALKRDTAA
jgi:DNA-binding MarR family transcriptional regulator